MVDLAQGDEVGVTLSLGDASILPLASLVCTYRMIAFSLSDIDALANHQSSFDSRLHKTSMMVSTFTSSSLNW